jgi:hypothetical protein
MQTAPPARSAALDAMAAPLAPKPGMRRRSRPRPTASDTIGPMDERPGHEAASNELEKTLVAANPTAPGSRSRYGVVEAS